VPSVVVAGGPRVTWRARSDSSVVVTARVPFGTATEARERHVRFTITLPRAIFRDHERSFAAFEALGLAIAKALPRLRLQGAPVRLRGRPRTWIEFARKDISILRSAMAASGPDGGTLWGNSLRERRAAPCPPRPAA
jgi:hypothetical protein